MAWKTKVMDALEEHGGKRVNGKVASNKTRKHTKEVIFTCFNDWHFLGYKLQDPKNVGERHIEALVRYWYFVKKLKIKTIEDYASRLRIFFGYFNKRLCKDFREYLKDVPREELVVRTAAKKSKSWAANGVDFIEKVKEADAMDWRLGLMLRMELAFGLRRKGVLMMYPWSSDRGNTLWVTEAMGKNGREREIPITTEVQRRILDAVKQRIGPTKMLGWEYSQRGKPATQEYNERRYDNLMQRLGVTKALAGVTGHGLRAQFSENTALLNGLIAPVLGGTKEQLSRPELLAARYHVSDVLGHNRPSITAAYWGTFKKADVLDPDRFRRQIQEAIAILTEQGKVGPVPPARRSHCTDIVEMMLEDELELLPSQVHALWEEASKRFGVTWIAPEQNVRHLLEGASFDVVNSKAIEQAT